MFIYSKLRIIMIIAIRFNTSNSALTYPNDKWTSLNFFIIPKDVGFIFTNLLWSKRHCITALFFFIDVCWYLVSMWSSWFGCQWTASRILCVNRDSNTFVQLRIQVFVYKSNVKRKWINEKKIYIWKRNDPNKRKFYLVKVPLIANVSLGERPRHPEASIQPRVYNVTTNFFLCLTINKSDDGLKSVSNFKS